MTAQISKLKKITFQLGASTFEAQLSSWQVVNNTPDGAKHWVFDDTQFIEESDPDYALQLTFFSDWRLNGISDFLTANDETDVAFVLDHHPDEAAQHVQWSGTVHIKAPTAGGEARATETTEITLQCVGKPVYTRI